MLALIVSLQSLIITVRKNFFSSVWVTVLLLVLIVGWSARGNIATFLERNPTAEQETARFNNSIVADSQINQALEVIRIKLNADRVIIRQYHNSKTDLTGLPFASVSTTYYAMAPGITLADGSFDSYPLSSINETLALMFSSGQAPHCTRQETSTVINPTYRNYIDKNGTKIGFACPIVNLTGQPVGMIGAGYLTTEKPRPSDAEIEQTLNGTGERVVGYLNNVIHAEHRPWYQAILGDITTAKTSQE